ncbi:MAG: hypothetical protein SPI59_04535 [Finegoldia sp.]|nr:hypothetical protein [Finegoldia sp.]
MNFLDNENVYRGTADLEAKNQKARFILKTEEKSSPDPSLESLLKAIDELEGKGLSSFVALESVKGVTAGMIQAIPVLIDDERSYTVETIPSTDEISLFYIDEVSLDEVRKIFEFFYKNARVKGLDLWNERMI